MPLTPGTKLGPYEVMAPLGAGGMGEVYRARDARLGRDVALKVLPEHLWEDRSALARFQTEAKAVAALSHPNIMAIFDVGEASGTPYAAAELLDGQTLRATLMHGPLAVRKALEVAEQIAQGLAAAHENGIVHRDIKPENVFLTRDGHVKILDFGLARRTAGLLPGDDTRSLTAPLATGPGVVVGTVAYMSPEQARGASVDHRTDQFSLGITLYEMLAGKRPFVRESGAETLAAIIREEPEPLEAVAPNVPAPLRWLVERLLAKDPSRRYDSTRDLALELRTWSLHVADARMSGSASAAEGTRRGWRRILGPAALGIAVALAGALVAMALMRRATGPASPAVRFEIRLPEGQYLSRSRHSFAVSADGKLIVYSAFTWKKPFEEENDPELFLRPLDSLEARPVPGTEGGIQPVFSPDGQHIAFTVRSESGTFLKRVPVAGGPAATICKCDALFGVAWSPDGSILFASTRGPLQKVPDTGGTPEPATILDIKERELSHRLPHLLPDGRTVVYTALRWTTGARDWKSSQIFVHRLGGNERSLLVDGGSDGRWVPPGNLLFAREGNLFAAPLNVSTLRLGGKPVQILEGVSHSIWTGLSFTETGAAMLDSSGARLLAWVSGSVTPEWQYSLVWFDGSGKETPVDLPKGMFCTGRVSPDGQRLLASYVIPRRQAEVLEFSRGARRNVTFEGNPRWAIWGPGPDRITFASDHEGPVRIYSRRIDAAPEEVETLWKSASYGFAALGSWSRDGKTLAFVVQDEKTGYDIWLLEAGKGARPFAASRFNEAYPDISPDGKWLLYSSNEPGRLEAFVRPLTRDGPPHQVSAGVGGGYEPLWSRDGSAIFYWALAPPPRPARTFTSPSRTDDRRVLFRVRVNAARDSLSFGRPERLFEGDYGWSTPCQGWDVAPDGRFLIKKMPDEADRRIWWTKVLADRILVDIGGLPATLQEAAKKR
jgi:eukaryotic-like serine/threonine-protein kinase